jgi:hypothetical protein
VRPGEFDADRFEGLLESGRRALTERAPDEATELLHAALDLWRGDVLADLRYARFAPAALIQLEELRWDAFEARNDADLELGRADAVLTQLEQIGGRVSLCGRQVVASLAAAAFGPVAAATAQSAVRSNAVATRNANASDEATGARIIRRP